MMKLTSLYEKMILVRLKKKNNICINVFGYADKLVFLKYISDKKFENSVNLLFVTDGDKSHYVYIKNFGRFMFHKTKNKNKKWRIVEAVYSVLVIKMCSTIIKKIFYAVMV